MNLENIVKEPTCFKSVSTTCIDLILTSDSGKFSNVRTIETGLSDFHAMVSTVLRGSFRKKGPRIVTYRDYSGFDNFSFREEVAEALRSNLLKVLDLSLFNSTVECILNKMAPLQENTLGRMMDDLTRKRKWVNRFFLFITRCVYTDDRSKTIS